MVMTRGRPPLRRRARAAFTPSRTRWRRRLRSISAKAAWICKKRPARRDGGVHGRVERAKPDAALVELVNEGDEFAGAPPETIEVEHDEDVTLAQVVKAGAEVRALGCDTRSVILEDPLATGLAQRVELAVEDLAPFGWWRHGRTR